MVGKRIMKEIYVTIYTKETGKLELTKEEWITASIDKKTIHRTDGPAVIYSNGCQFYYVNGIKHNHKGPAIVWADGTFSYYLEGLCYDKLYYQIMINKIRKLSKTERLIDERWWVREF